MDNEEVRGQVRSWLLMLRPNTRYSWSMCRPLRMGYPGEAEALFVSLDNRASARTGFSILSK